MQSGRVDLERIKTLRAISTIVIGLAVGIPIGLLGIGGGALLVPLMIYLFGMTEQRAHGTSLAGLGLIALVGALIYTGHGQVDWVVVIELAFGGVIGAVLGVKITTVPSIVKLRGILGFLVVVAGLKMAYDGYMLISGGHAAFPVHVAATVLSGGLLIVLIGILAGMLGGFLGVGSEIIMTPALTMLLGFSQTQAQGVSLAVIIPTAFLGAVGYAIKGNMHIRIAVWFAVGGIAGALIGASLANSMSPWLLKWLFGGIMLIIGILVIRRSFAPQTRI